MGLKIPSRREKKNAKTNTLLQKLNDAVASHKKKAAQLTPRLPTVALDVHRSKPPKKGEALFIEKLFRSQSTPHFAKPIFVFSPRFPRLATLIQRYSASYILCLVHSIMLKRILPSVRDVKLHSGEERGQQG